MSAAATAPLPRPDQRASDPGVSAWVSANAGAGKTHVLVNRVIRLLLGGAPPERLVCITFTRAAAAEMATRLFGELSTWAFAGDEDLRTRLEAMTGKAAGGDDLAQARRLFARALETPGGLKIQTIHAFCESILQRFPLEAGIVAGFEVLEEHSAAELIHEVRAEVLAAAGAAPDSREGAALAVINRHLQEDAFDRVISHCIARRGALARASWAAGEEEDLAALRPAIAAALGISPQLDETAVMEQAAGAEDLDPDTLRRWAAALSAGSKTDRQRADDIARVLALAPGYERYEATLALFLTGRMFETGRARRKSLMTRAVAEAEPELAEWAAQEQERVAALYEDHKAAVLLEATMALLTLSDSIIDAYAARKRARAVLDYDDLIRATNSLLAHNRSAWVLYKLDGGIDHVLIDEAQDTSPEQWEIVQRLTEEFFAGEGAREVERTIFAVGDEKQSIYSFQGADPDKFAEMREHFARAVRDARRRFEHVPLTASFRSTEEVLQAVDCVFAQPKAAEGLYAGGEALVHEAVRRGQPGRIEIWPVVAADPEAETDPWHVPFDYQSPQSPEVRLARRIAERIRRWLDDRSELTPRGRPIRAGDIMILVRRRNRFVDAMVRALKARGVPVAGADRMVLAEQIAVMDLIALGRFVLLPDDDLNLAALLKSPLVGLGEEQLFEIARERPGSLWQSLEAKAADGELAAAAERLRGWLRLADFAPPFSFYGRILEIEGGRRRMLARLGTEAEDPVNEFLALALDYEERATPSLQGFLHWLEGARTEIKRDMEHGRDEVRIMTVHGAKGLESNIVILPDTCTVPDARHDPPLMFIEADPARGGGAELPLWALSRGHDTAALEAARERLARRREGEYHRLLYVAMTRARDWLTVCGYEGRNGRSAGCWYDLVHGALGPGAQVITDEGGEILCWRIEGDGKRMEKDKEALRARPVAATAPAWSKTPLAPEPARGGFLAPSRLAGAADGGTAAEPPANSPLAAGDEGRFQRGRLIHALLQWLPAAPAKEREARARRYLARPAHGLAADAQEEIAAAVMAVLDDERFRAIFSDAGLAEVAVAGTIGQGGEGPVAVSGQIDRLLVTDAEIVIVDYKTNRPAPQRLAEVPPAYLRQMAAYRAVLARIYPNRRIRCALLWTDGPALMELPEEALARALEGA